MKENITEIVKELTQGTGVDKVFECSGSVVALNKGLEIVKKEAGSFRWECSLRNK